MFITLVQAESTIVSESLIQGTWNKPEEFVVLVLLCTSRMLLQMCEMLFGKKIAQNNNYENNEDFNG